MTLFNTTRNTSSEYAIANKHDEDIKRMDFELGRHRAELDKLEDTIYFNYEELKDQYTKLQKEFKEHKKFNRNLFICLTIINIVNIIIIACLEFK